MCSGTCNYVHHAVRRKSKKLVIWYIKQCADVICLSEISYIYKLSKLGQFYKNIARLAFRTKLRLIWDITIQVYSAAAELLSIWDHFY